MAPKGRPREFDRSEALDAAMELFWRHGYESASLSRLRQAMGGLSSASFYGAFGSKEALYRETLARYLDTHGQVLAAHHDEKLPPREALETALLRSVRLQTDATLPRGCMLVLSIANASPDSAHLQEIAATERRRTRDALKCCIDRGVQAGELRSDTDADGLAILADALLVGMSTQARDGVSAASFRAAVSSVLQLWDTCASRRRPDDPPAAQALTRRRGASV